MSAAGRLIPPPGYGDIVPFDRDAHRGLAGPGNYAFAVGLHAIEIRVHEFVRAATAYPIGFANPEARRWIPVILTGLQSGENLYVNRQGTWRRGTYVPAYVRRHPFCTAAVTAGPAWAPEFLVCVDAGALRPDASRAYFDAAGKPSAAWLRQERLIREMEAARSTTEAFAARLEALELLEPFEAHAHPPAGAPLRVQGLFRVNEDRLNALPAGTVKTLMQNGELSRIYAHLMSLDHFATLLDLRAVRGGRTVI